MQLKKKLRAAAAGLLSAAVITLSGAGLHYFSRLPDCVMVDSCSAVEELHFAGYPEISLVPGAGGRASAVLFGAVPVKSIQVVESEAPLVYAGGSPFGIKLLMDGVMVTELDDVRSADGTLSCPAAAAGISEGDVIRTAGGVSVVSNKGLQTIIGSSGGEPVTLTVSRGGETREAVLTPVMSETDGSWRGGMWVRDSIAGIGTMTYIDPETGSFAGLGHPVCDSETGELVPLQSGEAVPVELADVKKGEHGIPGELRGTLSHTGSYGVLTLNSGAGIFGSLSSSSVRELSRGSELVPLGYRQDVTEGEAYIYASVKGSTPKRYSVEIESVDYSGGGKDMVIHITDEQLIAESGGIVQGMSGSPVIQSGRLVGAVTHVFVADPTRGYGIFAESMMQASQSG
ncbi:MAG: SpoIVB peptidase [Ruminococcus sp.]|nr:SpoIVB peptidase [Ruminococcus sp.]